MRYQLDNEGYLIEASFGCTTGMCTEYTGTVPEGYETIEEWYEDNCECVGSWKIVDGNLVYDASRDYKLQVLYEQEAYNNAHVSKKEMGMTSTEEINPYTDLFPSHQSAGGYITYLNEELNKVGNLPTEEVNLTLHEEQNLDLIELEFIGNNFLPNTATSTTNKGITYTQNKDKTISIKGTATDRSTLNLAGTDTSVRNILTFKKGIMLINTETSEEYLEPYYYNLTGLVDGVSIEFYHYDGTDRTLIGAYNKGLINYDVDVNITQVVLVVESGITIDTTIKPMLTLVSIEHPILPMTKYVGEDTTRTGQYYVDGISTQNTRSGKNLYNATLEEITVNGLTRYADLQQLYLNGTPSVENRYMFGGTTFPSGTYTLCLELKSGTMSDIVFYLYKNETWSSIASFRLNSSNNFKNYITFTLEEDATIYLAPYMNSTKTTSNAYINYQIVNGSNADYEFEPYGVMPSPDYPSEIVNTYKAGTYNAVVDNKIYTITIEEDLRSVPNGVADRLWLNPLGSFDIERKVGSKVFDGNGNFNLLQTLSNTLTFQSDVLENAKLNIANNNASRCDYFKLKVNYSLDEEHYYYTNAGRICLFINKTRLSSQNVAGFKSWLSTHNTEVYYELATYTTISISEYSYNEYTYEEFKNNSTLIDLKGNTFTCNDKITIKDNQILLIKNGAIDKILDEEGNEIPAPREEIYLGDTVMPRTYTPYTHAYCHQRVYIDFKYKDPRNVDITKINLEGLILITNIETEYNFTSDDYTKVKNYIMGTEDLTDEEIELYDVNGDGVVSSIDYIRIKNMVDGVMPNTITGTLEINSTQSKRTIVLRDSEGKIKTSLGLNGSTTPYFSCEKLTLGGIEQPQILSGTSLPDEVVNGQVFLLYDE